MARKRKKAKQDPMRKLVQGILTLILSTLASWLASKLTDLILGPVEEEPEDGEE